MKLAKDELTKILEICGKGEGCEGCPMDSPNNACTDILLKNALCYLKENEPAPAGTDTSSKNNNLQLNDTADLRICQEKIADIKEDLLLIYEGMTNEEQRAWELGEIFNQMINLLKSGDGE